jgi:hypothetical protein
VGVGQSVQTYALIPIAPTITKGGVVSFNLNTTNLISGSVVNYVLNGVTAADVVGGKLSGSVTVDVNGNAVINIPTVANIHDGNQNLSVSLSTTGSVISSSVLLVDSVTTTGITAAVVNSAALPKFISDVQVMVTGSAVTLIDHSVSHTTQVLNNIQRIQFTDTKLALDTGVSQSAGQTALLIGAVLPGQLALDASKQVLLGAVLGLFDQTYNLQTLSGALMRLPIWDVLTGHVNATNADIANYLLTNINGGVAPSQVALNAAVVQLGAEAGSTQGSFLANLATSTSGQAHINLVGLQAHGLMYT